MSKQAKKEAIEARVLQIDFLKYDSQHCISMRSVSAMAEAVKGMAEKAGDKLSAEWLENLDDGVAAAIVSKVKESWGNVDQLPPDAVLQLSMTWPEHGLSLHSAWSGETIFVDTEPF